MSCPPDTSRFLNPSRYLGYQYIDIDIISILFEEIAKATGQKKGKMIGLWVLRVLLGVAFLAAGASKLAGTPAMVAMFTTIGFGQWFRILTGLLEVAGAIGLFVPRFAVYAASMLAVVMVGAIGFHLTKLGGNPVPPIILLLLAMLIVWLSKGTSLSEVQSK